MNECEVDAATSYITNEATNTLTYYSFVVSLL